MVMKLPRSQPPASLGEWAEQGKTKKRPYGFTPSKLLEARGEASRRAREEDWVGAKAAVFLGLYANCHKEVYGVEAAELEQANLRKAAFFLCNRFFKASFNEDPLEFAAFFQWVWRREIARMRRNTGSYVFRMTWRLMFSGTILTDWRMAKHRANG